MITTPEIICDVFSFLDKDQIERIQLVNQFWNNVIIRHKNILPLRLFEAFNCDKNYIRIEGLIRYTIKFDGASLSKIEEEEDEEYEDEDEEEEDEDEEDKEKEDVSSRYSQLTVDEVLTNLNDVVFYSIQIYYCDLGNLLNMMKLVTTKTGGRFRGRYGKCSRFSYKLDEIFDNYIIVDVLNICDLYSPDSINQSIREISANSEIIQLPSTPKEIILTLYEFEFEENEVVWNFTCNGKLNGANRLTIGFRTSETNYENFILQWFELYRTHQNPISLVGKFELRIYRYSVDSVLDAVKTFLNNTQLRVKYSLETKEFCDPYRRLTYQYFIRRCVLHETDSYALVIEMAYTNRYQETDMSSINASDLDQPPCDKMERISFCVKSL